MAGITKNYLKQLLAGAIAFCLLACAGCDQHHAVDEAAGWQRTGTDDTGNPNFPHLEAVRLWFSENPRYEERANAVRRERASEADGAYG